MTNELEIIVQKYGTWFFLAYIILKDGLPVFLRLIEKVVPAKIKESEKKLAAQIERDSAEVDLREREIVTQEMIGKNLVIMNERLSFIEQNGRLVVEALSTTNKGIAILLDRRKDHRSGMQS